MPEATQVRLNLLVCTILLLPRILAEYGGAGGAMYNVHNHGTKTLSSYIIIIKDFRSHAMSCTVAGLCQLPIL